MRLTTRRTVLRSMGASSLWAGGIVSVQAQSPIVFRVSASLTPNENSATHVWFERFSSQLSASAPGRFKFDYFPSGQLGKEPDTANQVKVGAIDMMVGSASSWATIVPEIGMLDPGYLFTDYGHVARALDGPAGAKLNKLVAERTGCTVLSWASLFGARNIYTKRQVRSLSEIKGVKIRVLPAPAFVETFKIMGATPTPMAFGELYMAVQTGVVDGFEVDAATVLASKLNEVTKFCWLSEHQFAPIAAICSRRAMQKIPADLMPLVSAAAADATRHQRAIAQSKEAEAVAALKQAGLTFSPMDASERAALRKDMSAKLWSKFAKQYPITADIYADIAKAQS